MDDKTTRSQERIFKTIQHFPGMTIRSAETIGRHVSVSFECLDPRPRGLKDDTFLGHVIIGPNGRVRGSITCLGLGCIDYELNSERRIDVALRCLDRSDASHHTTRVRGERAAAWLAKHRK